MLMTTVSFGQNFNPTVEVTNTYQGNASEVHKPLLGMNVRTRCSASTWTLTMRCLRKPLPGSLQLQALYAEYEAGQGCLEGT